MNKFDFQIDTTKNLLAFSAGVDSSALFYLLVDKNIPFDIAIVDYNQRAQSKDEVIYATQLAHKYNKKCFISTFDDSLKFSEKTARDFRHNFFDEIIKKENYDSLITAHQLNDMLEWFLMQLTKGAGLSELLSMQKLSYKNGYKIQKPLLEYKKQDLEEYLKKNNYKYFVDHTNSDEKYKRNYFRHNFSEKLLEQFPQGIKNSFDYLQKDLDSLLNNIEKKIFDKLTIYKYNSDLNIAIRVIDKELKQRGIIISKDTRDEIIKTKNLTVSHKINIAITEDKIFIAPNCEAKMDKKFKEKCRVSKIPTNIRSYISTLEEFDFSLV